MQHSCKKGISYKSWVVGFENMRKQLYAMKYFYHHLTDWQILMSKICAEKRDLSEISMRIKWRDFCVCKQVVGVGLLHCNSFHVKNNNVEIILPFWM